MPNSWESKREGWQLWSTTSEHEINQGVALALADFYDTGYSGYIPTYAEEQLAHIKGQSENLQATVDQNEVAQDDKKG